jgi:fumarylacetoacetate (FAA) hydrolase family protein
MTDFLGEDAAGACFLGRVWTEPAGGPSVVTVRDGQVVDITSREAPTVRDICEMADPAGFVSAADGTVLGPLAEMAAAAPGDGRPAHFLSPCDLQAVKACGVTFAKSMVERVIEERAAGDPAKAEAVRARIAAAIGESLRDVVPGSENAEKVKAALIREGLWSQYLEVGIGPYAEVFSKAQVLSSVGPGAEIGLHPVSKWNNPEPEVVLAVSSNGRIVGATLGNDVNLRDVEGRSALLLGRAKDNNASCALGPFIRLLDASFDMTALRNIVIEVEVTGEDGFKIADSYPLAAISRDVEDLVGQAANGDHQYPDGLVLFLGTMFAPVQDRDTPGEGFTHKRGDLVTIRAKALGALVNRVNHCDRIAPWSFGSTALMLNLAQRGLL